MPRPAIASLFMIHLRLTGCCYEPGRTTLRARVEAPSVEAITYPAEAVIIAKNLRATKSRFSRSTRRQEWPLDRQAFHEKRAQGRLTA
jgi:hypothetical protein